jgi:hypothetical protein
MTSQHVWIWVDPSWLSSTVKFNVLVQPSMIVCIGHDNDSSLSTQLHQWLARQSQWNPKNTRVYTLPHRTWGQSAPALQLQLTSTLLLYIQSGTEWEPGPRCHSPCCTSWWERFLSLCCWCQCCCGEESRLELFRSAIREITLTSSATLLLLTSGPSYDLVQHNTTTYGINTGPSPCAYDLTVDASSFQMIPVASPIFSMTSSSSSSSSCKENADA